MGGVQNLESSNVERPIFWNFEITNIKIAKDELFDYFIYEFIFYIHQFERWKKKLGGIQNLEWSNVERPIFWNFKITNIHIANDELFDYFIYEFIFYHDFLKLLEHLKYLIISPNYRIEEKLFVKGERKVGTGKI